MKFRNPRLIQVNLMMATALIVLLGFILYWLRGQYLEEKKTLLKEAAASWEASEQQAVDSLLMKKFVNPALDSSSKFNFKFNFSTDSAGIASYHSSTTIISDKQDLPGMAKGANSTIMLTLEDTLQTGTRGPLLVPGLDRNNLILKSVKLFVKEIADSSGKNISITTLNTGTDTALIKSLFRKKMDQIDPHMQIRWMTLSECDSSHLHPGMFVFSSPDGENILHAGILHTRWFLFRKILPQVLFAVFLLLLTLLAFIVSYRSYKSQLILNRQRNDFIHNMSHELKTPVATVKVALEALRTFGRKNEPEKMEEYLDMASAEAERLEMLVNRVIQLPENGNGYAVNMAISDLREIVTEALRSVKPRLESEGAVLSVLLSDSPCLVEMDVLHLRGVILNLVDNSLKYAAGKAFVEIRVANENGFVFLQVKDNGPSIPAEYRDKIFEKFFRVPSGDVHTVKGYGLGLSYARAVMELHRGTIVYQAPDEGGNLFELKFPEKGV